MQKGFTIIELIVAMTIFIIVIAAFMGLFISAMSQQKINLGKILLLNNGSYAAEYMSRAMRMAEKNVNLPVDNCVADKMNYRQPTAYVGMPANASIQFLKTEWDATVGNYVQKCQCFYLDIATGKIMVAKSDANGMDCNQNVESIIPANVFVEDLKFAILGDGQAGLMVPFQPIVTFTMKLKTLGADPQRLQFQASISQRALDIVK